MPARKRKMTEKERVLKRWPNAYAKYLGLSLRFVIVSDYRGCDLSRIYSRERDSWADAAKSLK